MPTPILQNISLFEALYGKRPVISHLKIFGYSCFPFHKPYNASKLQPKATKCVFLGYAFQYKGYICFDVPKNKYHISRHVVFNDLDFPYKDLVSQGRHSSIHVPSNNNNFPTLIPTFDNILVSSSSGGSISHHTNHVSITQQSLPLVPISPVVPSSHSLQSPFVSQLQSQPQSITAGNSSSFYTPYGFHT